MDVPAPFRDDAVTFSTSSDFFGSSRRRGGSGGSGRSLPALPKAGAAVLAGSGGVPAGASKVVASKHRGERV